MKSNLLKIAGVIAGMCLLVTIVGAIKGLQSSEPVVLTNPNPYCCFLLWLEQYCYLKKIIKVYNGDTYTIYTERSTESLYFIQRNHLLDRSNGSIDPQERHRDLYVDRTNA